METPILSVSQLNDYIKNALEADQSLMDLAVRGELSNYKIYPTGHHYFTLKDAASSLSCVMFRYSASRIRFRPENGMKVTALGRISVYTRGGAYQLNCSSLIPQGVGELQLAFEQLKQKLEAEGLFDRKYKKPIPAFPRRIALITSSAGDAVHDMIRILGKRWPLTKVILMPVHVQGVEAPPEIVGAIRYANEFDVADLIITGRGGGSMEDLWAFNDERVARAIFASRIPVISAVGHEPDVTISDFVADLRASTPSNAAELAVRNCKEIRESLNNYEIRARQAMHKRLQTLSQSLENLKNRRAFQNPMSGIEDRRQRLDHMRDRLISAQERRISADKQRFVALAASLDAMSPLRVLSRGYAVAMNEKGENVKSVRQLSVGQTLEVMISDGKFGAVVSSIAEKGENDE